jgi:hypothetical protein
MFNRWDAAFGNLHAMSQGLLGMKRSQALLDAANDRKAIQAEVREAIEALYSDGTPAVGQLALAWQLLTVDPRRAYTFWGILPQLTIALDAADLPTDDDADVRRRLRIWWDAAQGQFSEAQASMFSIAAIALEDGADEQPSLEPLIHATLSHWMMPPKPPGPSLVVMPAKRATKLGAAQAHYKDLVDAALPLVITHNLQKMRAQLHAEFPHATVAVDLLLRDLREAKPAVISPVCLVGPPGSGKSRLIGRTAAIVGAYLFRQDAGSSTDGHFGGTSKSWSSSEPSVPVRAVHQGRTASPWIMLDEIDKSASGNQNGALNSAVLPFLDVETASRYRDQSLDAEMDLSACSFLSTANDASKIPGPLRDRMRMIRVPAPSLAHLPALAAQVMIELARKDEARAGDLPLGDDELANIGRAWKQRGFSMRTLKAIVRGTLEARDNCAMRH